MKLTVLIAALEILNLLGLVLLTFITIETDKDIDELKEKVKILENPKR